MGVKEWVLLDNTVTELNTWVPRTSLLRARTSSPWRRWSPPLESSRTSSSRRKNWWRTCNFTLIISCKLHKSYLNVVLLYLSIDQHVNIFGQIKTKHTEA